jgi:hypothetical protein
MDREEWISKTVYFPGLLLGCFVVGWMIPTFYDWTGADQSYSTPAFDQMIWSLVGCGGLAWLVIPWLPLKKAPTRQSLGEKASPQTTPKRFQFNLHALLVLTTIAAVLFAVIASHFVAVCILIWVVGFVAGVGMIVRHTSWKWQFSALLACMYFPFAWVFTSSAFNQMNVELLLGAVGLPSFVPTVFIGRLLDTRAQEILWLWVLMVAIELVIGFCMTQIGPRCTTAYFVLVMLMSIYGSLLLNMGTRI